MVASVGVVGLLVVFVLIDPEIVVHIYPKQKLRPIDAKAHERLFVIGRIVDLDPIVVLVEIRYKVVVLVPPWEDLQIRLHPVAAKGVGNPILVVVVLNQFHAVAVGTVVDLAVVCGDKCLGIVEGIHAVGLAVKEERLGPFGRVHHPSWRVVPTFDARRSSVLILQHIGILAVAPAQVVLAVQVKAEHLVHSKRAPQNMGSRGQAIFKANGAQISQVADIAPRLVH